MSESDFLIENRHLLQRQVLAETTEDNELLEAGPPSQRKILRTSRKIAIDAINEILQIAERTEVGTTEAINTLLREVIGDYKDNPPLFDLLKSVDDNIIQALHKIYSMLIGDPENPHPIENYGDNLYEIVQDIYERIGHSPVPPSITSSFEYDEEGRFKKEVVTGDKERTSTIYYQADGSFESLVVEEGEFTTTHLLEIDPATGLLISYKTEITKQEGGS